MLKAPVLPVPQLPPLTGACGAQIGVAPALVAMPVQTPVTTIAAGMPATLMASPAGQQPPLGAQRAVLIGTPSALAPAGAAGMPRSPCSGQSCSSRGLRPDGQGDEDTLDRRPTDPFFYPTTLNPLTVHGLHCCPQQSTAYSMRPQEGALNLGARKEFFEQAWFVPPPMHSWVEQPDAMRILQQQSESLEMHIQALEHAKSQASLQAAQAMERIRQRKEQMRREAEDACRIAREMQSDIELPKHNSSTPVLRQPYADLSSVCGGGMSACASPACALDLDPPGAGTQAVQDVISPRVLTPSPQQATRVAPLNSSRAIADGRSSDVPPTPAQCGGFPDRPRWKEEVWQAPRIFLPATPAFAAGPSSEPVPSVRDSGSAVALKPYPPSDVTAWASSILNAHNAPGSSSGSRNGTREPYVDALGRPLKSITTLDLPNIKDEPPAPFYPTLDSRLGVASRNGERGTAALPLDLIGAPGALFQEYGVTEGGGGEVDGIADAASSTRFVGALPSSVPLLRAHERAQIVVPFRTSGGGNGDATPTSVVAFAEGGAATAASAAGSAEAGSLTPGEGTASARSSRARQDASAGASRAKMAASSRRRPASAAAAAAQSEDTGAPPSQRSSASAGAAAGGAIAVVSSAVETVDSEEMQAELEECLDTIRWAATSLTRESLQDMKAMQRPAPIVKEVLEVVAMLLGSPQAKWEQLKRFIGDNAFLAKIQRFNFQTSVTKEQFRNLRENLGHPEFDEELIKTICVPVVPLAMWCRAIGVYLSKTKFKGGGDIRPVAGAGATRTPQVHERTRGATIDQTYMVFDPDLDQLEYDDLRRVENLTISRPGVGSITFHGDTDCAGLDFERIVRLEIGEVLVYPDSMSKPAVGSGLNKPATVTMYQCWPPNGSKLLQDPRSQERYKRKIKQMTEEKHAHFIDYDCASGVWKFSVDHF